MNYQASHAAAVLIAVLALPSMGQTAAGPLPERMAGCPATDSHGGDQPQLRRVRIIEDPATHQHWLLERNPNRLAAPARLLLLPGDPSCAFTAEKQLAHVGVIRILVIHSGDALILSEHTPVSDARLEAVALSAAAAGEALTVRLKIGGAAIHAVAVASGQARITASEWGAQP